jgi:uncharacterized cupredoxin-like copper-binding protein
MCSSVIPTPGTGLWGGALRIASNRTNVVAVALVLMTLPGCTSAGSHQPSADTSATVHRPTRGMMGGASAGAQPGGGMTGGGMTGGGTYQYSPLRCAPPANLPGRTVTVVLADMGMGRMMSGTAPLHAHMMLRATPVSVPAGQMTLVVENRGWRTHELLILPLAADGVAGRRAAGSDGKVDEAGSLGEASASCAGAAGDGIQAGTVGWVTVTLAAGHYELVCNLPNHYADGMYQELVVNRS